MRGRLRAGYSHCVSTQENLLLDEQGNIKLIDFGLCGEPEVRSAPCVMCGCVCGSVCGSLCGCVCVVVCVVVCVW